MGLLAASTPFFVDPPNEPPEWIATPTPTWVAGVGGTYDLNNDTFDPESDSLTFVKTAGTWPTGVSLNSNGIITATSAVVEGTTAGFTVTADDGTNSPVASSSFSVEITASGGSLFYVATTGNDAHAGTITEPWQTIQYAVDNVSAGDTILVRGGTYNERVLIGVSGTVGNYITLRNFTGETPILDGTSLGSGVMIAAHEKSYYKVIGFEIQNHKGSGISWYDDCSHVEIRDNNIHDQEHESGNGHAIMVAALRISDWGTPDYPNHLITDVIVDGNTIGPNVDTGTPGIFDEALSIVFAVKRFQVTNNVLDDVSHIGIDVIGKTAWNSGGGGPALAPSFPQYGRIANNTIKNSGFRSSITNSMFHADGCKDVVYEDNLIYDCDGHGIDCNAEDDDFNNERVIYRRNKVLRTFPAGMFLGSAGTAANNIRWAHNSVFLNIATEAQWGMAGGGGSDIKVKNNIVQSLTTPNFILNQFSAPITGLTLDYNLYHDENSLFKYQGVTYWENKDITGSAFENYQNGETEDANSLTGDPLYVDAANNDLTPDTGSPAINAGNPLTTANGAGSSSDMLTVHDSRWFHDGMAIEGLAGDTIRVGANTVVITDVDYDTEIITMDSSISWSDGDSVTYPYNGAAPDMGAIET